MNSKMLLLACMLLIPLKVFAAAPDLSVGSSTVFASQAISIPVNADFTIPIGAIEFTIKYDPLILTFTSVTIGTGSENWTIETNSSTPGTLVVGMYNSIGGSEGGSAQTIAMINFTGNATQGTGTLLPSPNLSLSSVVFNQTPITAVTNGNVTYTPGILGNPTGSGKVSLADAVLVAQAVVGNVTLTPAQQALAEVDGGTTVDIYDAYLIAEYVVGTTTSL